MIVKWDRIAKVGNHNSYRIITTIGSTIFINEIEFSVASMQYNMKS
jgi:hypothetical protein